jgi:hypothetical protein
LQAERPWRQHIERERWSRSTLRDHCFDHELAESALYQWRCIIAERDSAAIASASASTAMSALVRNAIIDTPARLVGSPIDICLRKYRRVRMRSGGDHKLADGLTGQSSGLFWAIEAGSAEV